MAARTQLRTVKPYTGRRYGSFTNANVPDFMRGSLEISLRLTGDVKMYPPLAGDVIVQTSLLGKIETNP